MLKNKTYNKKNMDEKMFRELFQNISSGVAIYEVKGDGDDFIFKDINKAGEKIDKVKRKDIIGKSVLKLFPEIKNFGVYDVFKRVYKTGKPEEHPVYFYSDNRISGWRRNYVYKLPTGEIVSVFDDRTRQKETEELLKISEEFASSLMKNSPTPILVLNSDYSLRYMNPAFEKITGYKLDDLIGTKPPYPWWEKEMFKEASRFIKEISQKKVKYNAMPIITKSGNIVYLDITTTPVKDGGKLKYVIGSGTDVTERKEAVSIIESERNRFRSLIDGLANTQIGIAIIGLDYRIYYQNSVMEKSFGKVIGKLCYRSYYMDKNEPCDHCSIKKSIKDKKVYEVEIKARNNRSYKVLSAPFPNPDGTIDKVIEVVIDETERREIEADIIKKGKDLREAQRIAHIGSFNLDLKNNKITMSDEVFRILKIEPKKFKGNFNTIVDLFHPDDKEFALAALDNSIKNKTFLDIEHRAILNDKSEIFVDVKAKPFYDRSNKPQKLIGTLMDITQRKKAEVKLLKSEETLKKTLNGAISTLAAIVETKDPYTYGHQQRVCKLATAIAEDLGLDEKKVEAIRIASLIHDIGKVNIPASILSKPGKLTDIEFDMIKTHPQLSYNMLKRIEFPLPIVDIILQHHEKLDGSGYPRGLKGKDIMIEAKILTVADVVEAMSSHRPYRPALGLDVALDEIMRNKGILYDPDVAESCFKLLTKKKFKFD
jgi:PAS domain S-box-containing protein/putative nucleotidyltransferase with HDIG domain